VAKGVKLVPVRVLNCQGSGTNSGVIAGIDWVANNAARPAVANMSLGGGLSAALNSAVANAVAHGVTMVVAAGNENLDACTKSPASEPSAITVGAVTSADARSSFSNFGTCVDIFAPGSAITSASNASATATSTMSGTSMASPHVAGAAALALQANPAASPLAVTQSLLGNATTNRLASLGTGSPNRLLYSLAAAAPAEPPVSTIAISALSATRSNYGSTWYARVTVTVRDISTGRNAANVTVSGSFVPGGSVSCVTSSLGQCTVNSTTLSYATPSTTFTVRNATALGMVYDSSQNSATQIIVRR
jgi:subtilisin family serine protease